MKHFAHQKTSIAFLNENEYVFDMSDPGTGKTRPEIDDIAAGIGSGDGPAIVLAPKSALQSTWGEDIEKFQPDLTYSCAYANNREEAFKKSADVYITNLDAVNWLAAQPKSFFTKRFGKRSRLIIDESTAYKHRTSQRSKAADKIADYFELRRLMSGTPNPNGVCDLWHQAYLLDRGRRLGKSFFQFRAATCDPVQTGPAASMVKWTDRDGAELAVAGLLNDITIRHIFEECIDIPPNHNYPLHTTLPPRLMAQYMKLEKDSVLALQKGTINAINGAVLYGKLLQLASGAVYDENGTYHVLDKHRYEMTLDLVEAREHSVVAFLWEHQRDLMIEEAEKRGVRWALIDGTVSDKDRAAAVKNYQAGFYQVLFAHPQSAGHSLTLTRGQTTIWPSPTANLEHYAQFNRRIYRASQTKKTETINIIAKGTIDEKVYASREVKGVRMHHLLAALAE